MYCKPYCNTYLGVNKYYGYGYGYVLKNVTRLWNGSLQYLLHVEEYDGS